MKNCKYIKKQKTKKARNKIRKWRTNEIGNERNRTKREAQKQVTDEGKRRRKRRTQRSRNERESDWWRKEMEGGKDGKE